MGPSPRNPFRTSHRTIRLTLAWAFMDREYQSRKCENVSECSDDAECSLEEQSHLPRCQSDQVKISYRTSSVAVILVIAGSFAVPESLMVRPRISAGSVNEGVITFDPCSMWEQIGWTIRLAALIWFGTFLPLFVQGLRNRTLPRFLAVVCLIAFGWSLRNQLWRVQHCQSNFGVGVYAVWVATVALMCLHHVLQRDPSTSIPTCSR